MAGSVGFLFLLSAWLLGMATIGGLAAYQAPTFEELMLLGMLLCILPLIIATWGLCLGVSEYREWRQKR